jgi:dsRNA-specific ribonuclease
LIIKLLKKGNIKQKYIDILTSDESMEIYSSAFTSEQVDEKNNYQVYEQLGDLTGNKFIVWYIYDRFPQLKCAEGVKVAARLRINLGSKNSFCSIAENFGFWDFITATNETRQRKKKPLLEDTFEAFIGATETIVDQKFKTGVGYACVYKILSAIFDDINISLKYEDLYDSKTRLKELFDIHAEKLGPLKYEEKRVDLISYTNIYRLAGARYETKADGTLNTNKIIGNYKQVLIGKGSAALKADSEQMAASDALKTLATIGFVKFPPAIYSRFSGVKNEKKKTTEADVLKIIEKEEKINEQLFTKGKSKYQNKYTSTVLALYARKRDKDGVELCLNLGSSANIKDSEGMTVLDLLFIGTKSEKIRQIFDILFESGERLIHKNIFDTYCVKYDFKNLEELEIIE